jgi:hypothetical protein
VKYFPQSRDSVHYISVFYAFLANSTYNITATFPSLLVSEVSFNNTIALIIGMKPKHVCKKRLRGMIFDICEGCFHDEPEEIELEKPGNFLFSFACLSLVRGYCTQ